MSCRVPYNALFRVYTARLQPHRPVLCPTPDSAYSSAPTPTADAGLLRKDRQPPPLRSTDSQPIGIYRVSRILKYPLLYEYIRLLIFILFKYFRSQFPFPVSHHSNRPTPHLKMPLTVHHLQSGQSERIPWLCEELNIPYTLTLHQRAPLFAPQSIKDLNPLGQAPIIQDGSLTLAESAACVEYIIQVHGNGRLALPPSHKHYPDYLYWYHFSNGTLQPHISSALQVSRFKKTNPAVSAVVERSSERLGKMLRLIDARLSENTWLAGEEFTAADIMIVFTLTTMRSFYPLDLAEYQGIMKYLERVTAREGYKRARAKADPGLELMIEGKPPQSFASKLKAAGKI